MIMLTAGCTIPLYVKHTKAAITISLSARGSISLPKSVTILYLRAIIPSSISVSPAATKSMSAAHSLIESMRNAATKSGTIITLMIVNLFGMFTFYLQAARQLSTVTP